MSRTKSTGDKLLSLGIDLLFYFFGFKIAGELFGGSVVVMLVAFIVTTILIIGFERVIDL